jgi:1-acyl-sn-glycerol-3-phosphate acyltransferase
MSHVVFFGLRVFCGIRYEVQGRENLPAGNHVILMKHSSTWETYAIMVLFEPLVWVMKREILWIPLVGWGCLLARCIAIDRKAGASAVNQVLSQGKDRLDRFGAWILVFPEGTRMAPGETRRYGSSGTLLAAQEHRKIVPVAHNAGYFWPRRGLLKKRGVIRVIIGPPVEAAGRDPREVNEEVQQWIETHSKPS